MPLEYKCPERTKNGSIIASPGLTSSLACSLPTSNLSMTALRSCCPSSSKFKTFKNGCWQYCEFSTKERAGPVTDCLAEYRQISFSECSIKPDDVDPPYEPGDPGYHRHNDSYKHLSNKASLLVGLLISALVVEVWSA